MKTIFFFNSVALHKVEQSLPGMELEEKEIQKD